MSKIVWLAVYIANIYVAAYLATHNGGWTEVVALGNIGLFSVLAARELVSR